MFCNFRTNYSTYSFNTFNCIITNRFSQGFNYSCTFTRIEITCTNHYVFARCFTSCITRKLNLGIFKIIFFQNITNLTNFYRLIKYDFNNGTTSIINTKVKAFSKDRNQTDNNKCGGNSKPPTMMFNYV